MSIAQIRTLIADKEQFDRATQVGDGSLVDFEVPQKPIVATSETVSIDGVAQVRDTDYTIDNDIGLVTFGTAPAVGEVVAIKYKHTLISDGDIQTHIDLSGTSVFRAASRALLQIASNEALVQKKIATLDLQTDGPAVARELREQAKQLMAQAETEEEASGGGIDWAEMITDDFSYRERINKEALRNQ